ncbi:hypothetical protein O1611_g1663 [Lasiodiplodia mahajangana]|uniref:Uncharacterized protein n=1 Tax=Lasiodiplodia mahajangana TaxID=1108764 RepID=A0ACC2JX16_9PEZI|nr:hypothetical protein O1611_g1663 [Lasiodiplodia mahajangana]
MAAEFERLVESGISTELEKDDFSNAAIADVEGLKTRLSHWVYKTGAQRQDGMSLDDRLADYVGVRQMAAELLEMVERNIKLLESTGRDLQLKGQERKNSFKSIVDALGRLEELAKQMQNPLTRRSFREGLICDFLTEEGVAFGDTALSYVNWQFPKARKSLTKHLADSITGQRRLMLKKTLDRRELARRHTHGTLKGGYPNSIEVTRYPELAPDLLAERVSHIKSTSTIHDDGILQREKSLPSRYPTLLKDFQESPRSPSYVLCPYCGRELRAGELRGGKATEFWEHHIDEHLRPYICLFDTCPWRSFKHQSTWARHMKVVHRADWPRQFDNKSDWESHMRDLGSHPKAKQPPTDPQLKALEGQARKATPRDEHVCPVCEEIPENIRSLGNEVNPDDMAKMLEDHIAWHTKGLCFTLLLPILEEGLEVERGLLDVLCEDRAISSPFDTQLGVDSDSWEGYWTLQDAAFRGDLAAVESRLRAGADVNVYAASCGGRTALQAAAQNGHLDLVERLLTAGADVNAKPAEPFGFTALGAAIIYGRSNIVERLLAAGADVGADAGSRGLTALQLAANNRNLDAVRILLTAGADVNVQGTGSWPSALEMATEKGFFEISELLTAKYEDTNELV